MSKIIYGGGCVALLLFMLSTAAAHAAAATTASSTASSTVATTTILSPSQIETKVREYFADVPVMIEIAQCESNFRQFTDSGKVFYGGAGGGMVGVFQFYESIHAGPAAQLGFDLDTLDGNIGYAKHVYEKQGTAPWRACVPATSVTLDPQTKLKIEIMKKLIGLLQQLLEIELAKAK